MKTLTDEMLNQLAYNRRLGLWLLKKRWVISAPYAQWTDYHIIKSDGTIVPLVWDLLMEEFKDDENKALEKD